MPIDITRTSIGDAFYYGVVLVNSDNLCVFHFYGILATRFPFILMSIVDEYCDRNRCCYNINRCYYECYDQLLLEMNVIMSSYS